MILKELAWPFATGIGMFALLTIATIVLQEAARFAIRYNLSAAMFIQLFGLAVPQFVVLSIPMGVLLGTLIAAGRLSSDNEITALRAVGVSLYRALVPFLFVGAFLSGLALLGNEEVVPRCNSQLSAIKGQIRSGRMQGTKTQRMVVPIRENNDLRWLLVASSTVGTSLSDVKLFYFDEKDSYKDFYINAKSAKWVGDDWTFYDWRLVQLRPGDEPVVLTGLKSRVPGFSITPQSIGIRTKTADDLNIIQLRNLIHDLLKTGNNKPDDTEIRDFRTKLYFKYTIPLSPLFFIFIAFPLAIRPQRSSSTTGMGMALLIVLLYYIFYTVFQKLGATGVVPPLVAAWVPNTVMLCAGMAMLYRKERS